MEKTYRRPSKENRSNGGCPIVRGGGRSRKTYCELIKKDLYVNGLSIDIVYSSNLWRYLIHVVKELLCMFTIRSTKVSSGG